MQILPEEVATLVESGPVPEIFAQGVAEVELIGDGMAAFVFYRRQHGEKVAVLRLLMPVSAIEEVRRTTDERLALSRAMS